MSKKVLCLITDGFEEIETVAPVNLLRRAGVEVVVASVSSSRHVTGRCSIALTTDALLDETDPSQFDALLLPGGPMVEALRKEGRAAALATTFHGQGKPVAAICAAPLLLADAGLLVGRRFAAHDGVHAQLPATPIVEAVVVDGHLITSRGAGTSIEFGLALVQHLVGADKAREVAAAIQRTP
jgi:4-methyl-5(b-hydroxyethyl)-thiazole monophosphate biosynthesis